MAEGSMTDVCRDPSMSHPPLFYDGRPPEKMPNFVTNREYGRKLAQRLDNYGKPGKTEI